MLLVSALQQSESAVCISFGFSFGGLYVSRNLSISSRLSNLLAYNCSQYSLMVFFISAVSVVMSPFSFTLFAFSLFSSW